MIGSFHMHKINYADHKTEIGYAIEKGEEGKGYVTEAFRVIEAELIRLGFNKIVITCNSDNFRSIKFAERNGFQREGLFIEDFIESGAFRDSVVFGKRLRKV